MEEQAMLARDLVLRVCAGPTEFDPQWVRAGGKVTTPFSVPRDRNLIRGIVDAGRALGVDRLLVCRTRGEFSYEAVTEVPLHTETLVDLIRGWGNAPTDFLVCVEDFSAAVLVAANELTVASGPADFVREIVGSDIPGVREEFAAKAQRTKRPELLSAAQRYHCIEPGARHARNRGPGPDLHERLSRRAERARARSPRAVRSLRAARGGWNWLMVVLLLVAPLSAPELGPALPALLLTFVLLLQLAFLARSRTVSFATLARVVALGALLLWPVALLEGAIVGLAGLEPYDALGYTYVAVTVEEVAKLSPLLVFALLARRRMRRMASADFLLLGAASGAGFQLAERLFTEFSVPNTGSTGLFLPGGSTISGPEGEVLAIFSGHAVVTGLIAGALGLAVVGRRRYGNRMWLPPILAVSLVYLEHLHFNALLAVAALDPFSTLLHRMLGGGALTPWLLLSALVFAVGMDHRLIASAAESTPPLPGRAPLARLRRWAHGRSISTRVRVPADIAPMFRRTALSGADLPITLATTITAIVHEFAAATRAARRGPGALCDTLRFLRRRRANAMGEVRSQGRPWRRHPSQEELAGQARELSYRLGLAGTATGTVVVAAVALTVLAGVVRWGVWNIPGPPEPAYAVVAVDHLQNRLARADTGDAVWTTLVGVAVVSLLSMGNAVPYAHPRMREFLRAPTANTGVILGMLAPGQVGYALPALVGLVLPRRADRLLTR